MCYSASERRGWVHRPALLLGAAILVLPAISASASCVFVTDTDKHAVPSTPKPPYLTEHKDPVFGLSVFRVTGDPGTPIPVVGGTWGTRVIHHYSKDQPWNADMSLLFLLRGGIFVDGETYEVRYHKSPPGSESRWHPVDPDLFIYITANQVGTWNVKTDENKVLRTFSGYSAFSISEANVSLDGKRVAIYAKDPTGKNVGFAYDMAVDKKYPDFDPLQGGWGVDWISITPLGDYIVQCKGGNSYRVFDLNGSLVPNSVLPDSIKHADIALDPDGTTQWLVGAYRDLDWGNVARYKLPALGGSDNQSKILYKKGIGNSNHVSCRSTDPAGRGWCFVSNLPSSSKVYADEVTMVKLDGSEVRRLAHLHAPRVEQAGYSAYYSEAHACPSPDASKVVWASNWDESGSIGAYVVDVCKHDATRIRMPPVRSESLASGRAARSTVEVYGIDGRFVMTTATECLGQVQRHAGLPSGIYIVRDFGATTTARMRRIAGGVLAR
jgi:hypothetical protein